MFYRTESLAMCISLEVMHVMHFKICIFKQILECFTLLILFKNEYK